jgi:hypothetical protein
MNPVWHQVIRTGNVAADQQALATAQAHAAQQGLTLQVESLPQGGLQVVTYSPAPAAAMCHPTRLRRSRRRRRCPSP